jgi:putative membrane protein
MSKPYLFNLSALFEPALLLALCAAPVAYSQKPALALSHSDSAFMKDAAEGGMDEVKLGQLAAMNSMSDRARTFGQKMVNDHTKLGNELQALAARKNVPVPADISVRQKASYKLLSEKHGPDFDKAYISSMVQDHEDDIAAFQKEADSGADDDVRAFAAKALPMLQEHLRLAQDIARELGVSVK